MTHQQIIREQRRQFQKAYATFYADSFEYSEQHLNFLRRRRDAYLQSLRPST